MLYKIFNGDPRFFSKGDPVPKLRFSGSVIVAIDPSKSNCAVVVGNPLGEVDIIVEMTGNNWKSGPTMDTTQYCVELNDFLSRMLANNDMYCVGLEKAITKKGMEHHHSNMVLTEIRSSILSLFYEKYGLRAKDIEVNNWSWKRAILPEGYRGQSQKGSYTYFRDYLGDTRFVDYFEADVTDCMCIYKYLLRTFGVRYSIACRDVETTTHKYTVMIMPPFADDLGYQQFEYNPSCSIDTNAAYYVNRTRRNGIAKINKRYLSYDDIYKYAYGFVSEELVENVRVIIQM